MTGSWDQEWSQEDIDRIDYHRPWWQWNLTPRGLKVMTWIGVIVAFLIIWTFIAIGIYLTGAKG